MKLFTQQFNCHILEPLTQNILDYDKRSKNNTRVGKM